jgi:hypothetical protein
VLPFQHVPADIVMCTGCLYQRIIRSMKAHGLHEGHTIHSYRRGHLQHLVHTQGHPQSVAAGNSNIKTPALQARYLDKDRHHGRRHRYLSKVLKTKR